MSETIWSRCYAAAADSLRATAFLSGNVNKTTQYKFISAYIHSLQPPAPQDGSAELVNFSSQHQRHRLQMHVLNMLSCDAVELRGFTTAQLLATHQHVLINLRMLLSGYAIRAAQGFDLWLQFNSGNISV